MATSRIKIEVDFDNAVAKIDQLKVGFREIGERTVEARDRILKMVTATKVAAEGSVKALQREKAAWQQIQASLSTTNQEYRKYQVQIDALDKQIDKITDTRKREEIALKNSANGIRQQIALIQQEMENRKLSNTQYRVMNEEVAKLEARLQALTDTRQKHQIVQKNSIADFDQQIAALREEQRNTALSAEQVERYEQRIESLRLKKRALTGETKGLDKASQSFSSSAGAAGATVTEFGRTIGDLPFGLIGITNNIQQLSQQFTDLQAKSGGTRAALQSVMKTMMGPAGFVVLINIATSALLYFTQQKQKANKEAEDFNDSMLTEGKTFEGLITLYHELNAVSKERAEIIGALAQSDKDLADALEKAGSNEAERAKIAEQYIKLKLASNQADEKRAKIAQDNKPILERQLMSEKELADEQERINDIASATVRQTEQVSLNKRIEDNEELKEVLLELADATLEYSDAQKALNEAFKEQEISKVKESFAEFREELRLENFEEGTERIAEQLRVLRDSATGIAQTYGTDSAEFEQLMLDIAKKEKEFRDAEKEQRDDASKKEKERLEELGEMNKQYLDDLEAQLDESGIIRLNQQERDAIAEAKALGASRADLLRIEQFYANERQNVLDEIEEKANEKKAKNDEKKAKEDEKNTKEGLERNKKRLEEFFDKEIEAMKSRVDVMSDVFSNFGNVLDELDSISQSRFERQINQLKEQRDIIRTNDALTKEEKEQQLTDIQRKENDIQRKRIKSERDMFTLKQTIVLAEMVLKQKAFVQEQIMMAQLITAQAKLSMTAIALTAAEETAEASMSIGTFMKQLGPWGIAAFALSIGGVIASIVSARRKASAEIAGLSDAPISLGGGGGGASAPAAPSFNVVGASAQNQLAAAIAGQQSEPVRAYVVSSDVSTAQELDRKIVEGASI
jgi:hypothetical protein